MRRSAPFASVVRGDHAAPFTGIIASFRISPSIPSSVPAGTADTTHIAATAALARRTQPSKHKRGKTQIELEATQRAYFRLILKSICVIAGPPFTPALSYEFE